MSSIGHCMQNLKILFQDKIFTLSVIENRNIYINTKNRSGGSVNKNIANGNKN